MALWREGVATGAADVANWALAELGIFHEHPAVEHLIQHFEEASHSSRVRALDGARATLEALARTGVRRGLVCDTGLTPGRVVRLHLSRLGLLDLLEAQAFSDEVGVPKPKPGAFHAALGALGVDPADAQHTAHVGDLRSTDVAGARALGMTTIRIRARYDDTSSLDDADFVVDSHDALRDLLTDGF
jgi:putative hydrolase of the HAD superfamily